MELASPLYAELSYAVSESPELLALAAHTRPRQPPPNMLFGAVQYLLLRGAEHPLAAHYPIVSGEPRPMKPAAGDFRDFCRAYAGEVAELVRTRRTQTNVVRRCTCLVPAFSIVSREAQGRPLHLIDLGASAGLNLNFDRYGVRYACAGREVLRWGDAGAVVGRGAARPRAAHPPPAPPRGGGENRPTAPPLGPGGGGRAARARAARRGPPRTRATHRGGRPRRGGPRPDRRARPRGPAVAAGAHLA
ncbi:MAG: DUF2332 family protein [Gammaproteobacteria bacterium]|nr:DUF2332 family protein [Gammaproteobacteria bacterium]